MGSSGNPERPDLGGAGTSQDPREPSETLGYEHPEGEFAVSRRCLCEPARSVFKSGSPFLQKWLPLRRDWPVPFPSLGFATR